MKKLVALFVVFSFIAAFADNPHITRLIELIDVAISSPADGDVLTFDSSVGKWGNKQAAKPLRNSFVSHPGSMGNTALFTPSSDGEFYISVYLENVTSPYLGQTLCSTIHWTDDVRLQDSEGDQCAQAPFLASTTTRAIHAKANTPISISVDDFGTAGQQTFSMYVTIQQF